MNRKQLAAAAIIGLTASLFGGTAANAATVYSDRNYTGDSFTTVWAPNVNRLNDRISSFRTYGDRICFYEDVNFKGRQWITRVDHNDLKSVWIDGKPYFTWNDRISSFVKC